MLFSALGWNMILWFTKKDNLLLKPMHMFFARFLITDSVVMCLYLESFKIKRKTKINHPWGDENRIKRWGRQRKTLERKSVVWTKDRHSGCLETKEERHLNRGNRKSQKDYGIVLFLCICNQWNTAVTLTVLWSVVKSRGKSKKQKQSLICLARQGFL